MKKERSLLFNTLFFVMLLFIVKGSFASSILKVNVSGNILPPVPCIINNTETIKGNFGELYPVDFDGVKNKIELIIPLSCNQRPFDTMKFSISGTPSSFNNNAISTGREDIGVEFYYKNKLVIPKNDYPFNYATSIKIDALLIKNPKQKLISGDFTAVAFLNVDYL